MPRVKKFRLYAGRNLEIPQCVKYSFIPSHMQYLLLYTDSNPGDGFAKVSEDLLSREEHEWLLGCKYAVNSAEVQKNLQSYNNFANGILDILEKELTAEQRKIAKNNGEGEKETSDSKKS